MQNPFMKMLAMVGLVNIPPVHDPRDRRYGIMPTKIRGRGTPRRKLITKKQRRHKRAIQAASRHINRSQQRRHPS